MGEGLFSRVVPGPSPVPRGVAPPPDRAWREWGRARYASTFVPSQRELDDARIALTIEELRRPPISLPQHILDELSSIDSRRWYAVTLVVEAYHTVEDDSVPSHATVKRRLTFAGIGRRLWYKVAGVAEVSEIVDVEVHAVGDVLDLLSAERAMKLAPENQAWAVWADPKQMTVQLADGQTFYGRGDYERWKRERDQRKGGRPAKRARPGLTKEQTRKVARAEARRRSRFEKWLKDVETMTPAQAKKERRRRDRIIAVQRKKKAIFARAKPRGRKK